MSDSHAMEGNRLLHTYNKSQTSRIPNDTIYITVFHVFPSFGILFTHADFISQRLTVRMYACKHLRSRIFPKMFTLLLL